MKMKMRNVLHVMPLSRMFGMEVKSSLSPKFIEDKYGKYRRKVKEMVNK